jgi:hypothetical protein
MGQVQHQRHLEVKNDISYKYGLMTRDTSRHAQKWVEPGEGEGSVRLTSSLR